MTYPADDEGRQPPPPPKPPKQPFRWGRALAITVALLLGISMIIPVGMVLLVGRQIADTIVPQYAGTLQRLRRAETMRRFVLPSDSSITPIRAGEAMMSLGSREGQKIDPVTRRPARGPYTLPAPDPSLFPDAKPTDWKGPQSKQILLASQRGFSREEMDYLASLAANPIWQEYTTVARAPRMDLAGAFYKTPFPERYSVIQLPIMKFAATKEIAYANTSRAAWHLANHRPDSAEIILRETISNGFRILDDGNMLIDDLIGVVVVGIGEQALEQFFEITRNPELARLRSDRDLLQRTPIPAAQLETNDPDGLARAMTDTTLPRGLRFELVTTGNLATCTTLGGLFGGPPQVVKDAMVTARKQLVRTPAEGDVFDLGEHVVDRPSTLGVTPPDAGFLQRLIVWTSHVPGFLLRNPRIVNCAGGFAGGLAGAM